MKRRTRSAIVGAVCGTIFALILTVSTAPAQESKGNQLREEFHQTYPLAANGTFELDNVNGDVRVSVWDRNEVKVDAAKFAQSKERLDEAQIVVDATSNAVRVKTKYPERSGWRRARHDSAAKVDYSITLPRNLKLTDVSLVNGELTMEGVGNEVRADCVNGRLSARGLAGRSKLSTVNGSLDVSFDRVQNDLIDLESVNGRIELTLPSDVEATLRATTLNGAISNDWKLPIQKGRYVGRKLEGKLGNGGATIRMETVNGRIMVRHASDGKSLSAPTNLLTDEKSEGRL